MIALAAAALLAAASAPQSSAQTLESLEHMYQQSCSVKAYGSYDDICNGLKKQMREAEKHRKQEERDLARAGPARAQPASEPAKPVLGLAPAKD